MECRTYGYEGVYSQFSRSPSRPYDFERLEFQTQDLVVLSTDKDLAFAYGIVVSIDPPKIILKLDRYYKLHKFQLETRLLKCAIEL